MFDFWDRYRNSARSNGYSRGAKIKPSETRTKRDGTPFNNLHVKKGQSFYSLRYLSADHKHYIIGLYPRLEDMPRGWQDKYFVEHWKPNMDVVLHETMWMEDFYALQHSKMKNGKALLSCWGMDGDTRPMQELHFKATGKEWTFKTFGKVPA